MRGPFGRRHPRFSTRCAVAEECDKRTSLIEGEVGGSVGRVQRIHPAVSGRTPLDVRAALALVHRRVAQRCHDRARELRVEFGHGSRVGRSCSLDVGGFAIDSAKSLLSARESNTFRRVGACLSPDRMVMLLSRADGNIFHRMDADADAGRAHRRAAPNMRKSGTIARKKSLVSPTLARNMIQPTANTAGYVALPSAPTRPRARLRHSRSPPMSASTRARSR